MKIIKIVLVVILVALLSFCKTTSNSNDKPNPPSNPTPADGSTNVAVNTDLEWECTDPDGLFAREGHEYWMDVAVTGQDRGGVFGNLQTAGASVMTAFIDFWGSRTIQGNAEEIGWIINGWES